MTKQVFFYKAFIMRDDRRVCKEGTIQATFPMTALDELTKIAVNEWKKPLLRIELYEINDDGALVATSRVSERIDAVLQTHKELGTGKVKFITEAREKRDASHSVKKDLPKLPAPKPTTVTEWNWVTVCGKYEAAPNYATLKLQEGAFK